MKAEVVPTIPGTYTVGGVLKDGTGHIIQVTEEEATLETTPIGVVLLFEGATISRHGADGPYQVLLTISDATGNDLMQQEFTTSTYACGNFESR